jgi:hypothetical protein
MKEIFAMVTEPTSGEGGGTFVHIGIPLSIGGHVTTCPISNPCSSYGALEAEVQGLKANLDALLHKAEEVFEGSAMEDRPDLRPDMTPEEIWSILSELSEEDLFVKAYNDLGEEQRREVAEHVLTHCNVFSGKAATFSSRYNSDTGLLE